MKAHFNTHLFSWFFLLCLSTYCLAQQKDSLNFSSARTTIPLSKKSKSKNPNLIESGKRLALLIGNANYVNPNNSLCKDGICPPINDATDLAKELVQLGFDTIHLSDANKKDMLYAREELAKRINKENYGTVFFYFAGHAGEFDGKNYLYPIDADPSHDYLVEEECIDLGKYFDVLDGKYRKNKYSKKAKSKIVILDACRDNPFARSWNRSDKKGLNYIGSPEGTFLVYATAPGQTAENQGTNKRNGLFTQHLLNNINDTERSLFEVFQRSSVDIYRAAQESGQFQVPFLTTSMGEDLYLNQKLTAFKENGKWGYKNRFNQTVIDPDYKYAFPFYKDQAAVVKDGMIRFINKNNEELKEALVAEFKKDTFSTKRVRLDKTSYAFIDKQNKNFKIINNVDSIRYDKPHWAMKTAIGWGFIDQKGNPVGRQDYVDLNDFQNGFAIVKTEEGWGFIDEKGNPFGRQNYYWEFDFENGFARVQTEKGEGFIDEKGNPIGRQDYDDINDFQNGLAQVKTKNRWGFIDEKGNPVGRQDYYDIGQSMNGFARVETEEGWGFIDEKGNPVGRQDYKSIGFNGFVNGFAQVMTEKGWGFINEKWNPVGRQDYYDIDQFRNGYAEVRTGRWSYGFIDENGNPVGVQDYEWVRDFYNGFARVKTAKGWGFIDEKGNPVGGQDYSYIEDFQSGFARVETAKGWGFVDEKGNPVGDQDYNNIEDFQNGFARVETEKGWGFVDEQGNSVGRQDFIDIEGFQNGFAIVTNQFQNYGILDKNIKYILEPEFDEIERISGNDYLIRVMKNFNYRIYNVKNKVFIGNRAYKMVNLIDSVIYYLEDNKIECYNTSGDFLYFETNNANVNRKNNKDYFNEIGL